MFAGFQLTSVTGLCWHFSPVLMSETHDGSFDPPMTPSATRSRRRRKAKAHKILEGKLRFVVGHDVYMDRVEALCSCALIGRLEYCSMDKKS